MEDIFLTKIKDLLKSKGIRPTVQRLEILNAIHRKKQHLTAIDLSKIVNEHHPRVSRASLFKNLSLFLEVGLVKEIKIGSQETIYDSNMEDHHHIHDLSSNEFIDINIEPDDEKAIRKILLKNIGRTKHSGLTLKNLKIIVQTGEGI